MRIAFIIAPWKHIETYPKGMGKSNFLSNKFGLLGGVTSPLGIQYISSYLKSKGHHVIFLDGFFRTKQNIFHNIRSFNPDIIGFNVVQWSWERTKLLVNEIKQLFPGILTVVGGHYATAARKECLQECQGLDFVIIDEGEETFVELCNSLENKSTLNNVKGLIFRENGVVVENEPREFIKDLDKLPFPDYDLVDIDIYAPAIGSYKYLPSTNMITSRGCPYNCSFCHSRRSLRLRSVENSVDEIEWLVKEFDIKHIIFYDEIFPITKDRVLHFCDELRSRDIKVAWAANARVDSVDKQILIEMRKAGCWRLHYGIESGVQKNLDKIGKGISLSQVKEIVPLTKKIGMEVYGSFIFGIPGETYKEGLKTIDFACSLPIDYVNFINFTPVKESPIAKNIAEYGTICGPFCFHRITFVPYSMTRQEMANLMVLSHKRYYMRPKYIFRRFFQQRSILDIRRNLRGFLAYTGLTVKDQLRN